ncbi:hypothetical protein MAMO4S_05377 [Mesorhizobium amorphae]
MSNARMPILFLRAEDVANDGGSNARKDPP